MIRFLFTALSALLLFSVSLQAQERVLIPMDGSQSNHLKAYGIIFNHLVDGETGQWLLNYRGGSFLTTNSNEIVRKSRSKERFC